MDCLMESVNDWYKILHLSFVISNEDTRSAREGGSLLSMASGTGVSSLDTTSVF